jgi:hypothetical protein
MSVRRIRQPRRLSFQQLESRSLMAGDVAVWMDGDMLHIQGDSESNAVRVFQLNDTTYVDGLFSAGGEDTTVNGRTLMFKSDRVRSLDIDMGDGNDTLDLTPNLQRYAGMIEIQMGTGSDRVSLEKVEANGISIETRGGGADTVIGNQVTTQNLRIDTAEDADTIDLKQVVVARHLAIDTTVDPRDKRDTNDNVSLQTVQAEDIQVLTGDGRDTISILKVQSSDVTIDTGRHNDTVIINELTRADLLFVRLGEGDLDVLDLRFSAIQEVDLDGGPGSADVLRQSNNSLGNQELNGFEAIQFV